MSKVLVDRELLELLRNFTFLHDAGCAGVLRGNIDKALAAQPAEEKEVDIIGYMDGDYRRDQPSIYIPHVRIVKSCAKGEALMTVTQHLADLSAVTAERDRLREDISQVRGANKILRTAGDMVRDERDQLRAVIERQPIYQVRQYGEGWQDVDHTRYVACQDDSSYYTREVYAKGNNT